RMFRESQRHRREPNEGVALLGSCRANRPRRGRLGGDIDGAWWAPVCRRLENRSAGRDRDASPHACMSHLDGGYLARLGTFRPLLALELNALVLLKGAKAAPLDLGIVDEEVLPAVVRGDETVALFAVEPFHSSLRHLLNFSHSADAPKNPTQ